MIHYGPKTKTWIYAALLGTAADLVARLDAALLFSYKFCRMCRRWFPATYQHAITSFLQASAEELDVGFSWQLQCVVLALDGELLQRAFLSSPEVQDFLEDKAVAFSTTSLTAERLGAGVKRREARNISLVSNVSRNMLCTRFARQNEELASELAAAQVDVRRLKISRWNSIAWE